MSAAEKANLARIRDNQRRSRARRKEYLQEIEARLRQCELQGIEASTEIQLAARRVADENKKLRIFLHQLGVGEDMVAMFLQSIVGPELTSSVNYGRTGEMQNVCAIQVLEDLLNTRKQCCQDSNTGASQPLVTLQGGQSRESSIAGSISTIHSVWHSSFESHICPQDNPTYMNGSREGPQCQFMSPPRSVCRTGSVVSSRHDRSLVEQQQPQPQRQGSQQPPTTPPINYLSDTASSSSQQTQPLYEYEPYSSDPLFHGYHLQDLKSYPCTHKSSINNILTLTRANTDPHAHKLVSQTSQCGLATSTRSDIGSAYNCVSAIDMITTMAGGDPNEVRTELGCLPNEMECEVDNQLVFNVIDRYSEQRIGI